MRLLNQTILCVGLIGIFSPVFASTPRKIVQCDGYTVVKNGEVVGGQVDFSGVFNVSQEVVSMVQGDTLRFAKSYKLNSELTRPERAGYVSNKGNLFLHLNTGKLEIISTRFEDYPVGTVIEHTIATCKPYIENSVFK
ncbi:hypothetical protein [Pseudomonas weihenstephanensis]|uniref:Phage protein n=1 Tax=Pseudomonas weihenstephanensis TaxID=1608994 RepID=A0ABS1ZGI8_9PSED|nr:hypothetical protein [Pseudomonas weihenstephanensis]MBM1195538.1 hypothetical protein [Pseudomonas weihenstephanensis]